MRTLMIMALAGLAFLSACQRPAKVDAAFLSTYGRDPDHGLFGSRTTNGVVTTVRIVPAALCALQEFNSDSCGPGLLQLLKEQREQLRVIVELAPDTTHFRGDIMTYGSHDLRSYLDNAFQLNFGWEDMAELHCGTRVYKPVLSTLENTYGLTKTRNVMLVFAPAEKGDTEFGTSPDLDIVLDNTVFGTGIQHFRFSRTDLSNVPQPTS
jgi:hypothetical protein